jgi:hypothetical protein
MLYWSYVPALDEDDDEEREAELLEPTAALFRQQPSDQLHLSFVVLMTNDDGVFVASHSVMRLCGALAELLDEIDADTAPAPYPADASTVEIVELLPAFEVDATMGALRSVLEFLVLWLENGRPSVLARPLVAPLQHLVSQWEWDFLQAHAFVAKPKRPSAAAAIAAVVPFVREPSAARLFHQHRGTLSAPAVAPLLQMMRAADYLAIDALRDLTCAFLASLVTEKSEGELADALDMDRPLTEEELEPMFAQHPFLRPSPQALGTWAGSPASATPTNRPAGGRGR